MLSPTARHRGILAQHKGGAGAADQRSGGDQRSPAGTVESSEDPLDRTLAATRGRFQGAERRIE